MLSKQKDTDFLIMENLDDRSLLNYCMTNKKGSELCKDEGFWRRRFISKYGENAAKYKPVQRTWRQHFLKILIDLDKFSTNPERFLTYILWGGTPKNSFYNAGYGGNNIPFLQSPEWVINNFYLLDLGQAYINGKIESHITPAMLFESKIKTLTPGMLVNGHAYAINNFWRRKH